MRSGLHISPAREGFEPFTTRVEQGRLELSFPAFATVRVKQLWRWTQVHSGEPWGRLGVLGPAEPMTLRLPLDRQVSVSAHGRQWRIRYVYPAPSRKAFRPVEWLARRRSLAYSMLAHAAVFGVLLWLASLSQQREATRAQLTLSAAAKPRPSAGAGAMSRFEPFGGMTYARFVGQQFLAQAPTQKMQQLMKRFGAAAAASNGAAQVAAQELSAGDATGGEGLGNSAGESDGLSDSIRQQKYQDTGLAAGPRGPVEKKLTAAQKALVKRKFQEIQEDLRRVYSQALMQAPGFSVTVAFETKVMPSGYLSLHSFNAKGGNSPAALQTLRSGMERVFRSVYLGNELSGSVIRGENVFVH